MTQVNPFKTLTYQVVIDSRKNFEKVHFSRHQYRTEYLKSDDWKEKSKKLLLKFPICQVCDKNTATAVHHLTYERVGCEIEETDLITICPECHNRIHRHRMLADRKSLMILKWLFEASKTNKSLLVIKVLPKRKRYELYAEKLKSECKKAGIEYIPPKSKRRNRRKSFHY